MATGNVEDPLNSFTVVAKSLKANSLRNKELEAELTRTKNALFYAAQKENANWDRFEKSNPHLGGSQRKLEQIC